MELAMQSICCDKTVGTKTVRDSRDFNSQSLATQAKKGEELNIMTRDIKETFHLTGDEKVELFTQNE